MSSTSWLIAKRQIAAIMVFLLLFAVVFTILFEKDRQQEWRLRQEQSNHRLQLGFEMITRDLERVRSDILYVASQNIVKNFDAENAVSWNAVESAFNSFLHFKQSYQQIRLVNRNGREALRVDLLNGDVIETAKSELQDKSSRYYIRDSLALRSGEVFVSEFDLNQERESIEQPLNPVIRFVTPVADDGGSNQYLLVLNYRGSPLLNELQNISLPGQTFLLRDDGQYLLGPSAADAWGWLLGHSRSFANQFPTAWQERDREEPKCILNEFGAFEFRSLPLHRFGIGAADSISQSGKLWIVSHLPRAEVFATSNRLLKRLLFLAALTMLPLIVLTRFWAVASVRRQQQNVQIQESEKKLRALSSRLFRIQEDERRAISREIHDQLGQQVTAINLDLKLARQDLSNSTGHAQLDRAIQESEQLLNALHDFATRVRPDVLDDLGLHDAVESHLWDFKARSLIAVTLESEVNRIELPAVVEENVFRLIQESLNNVLKHSQATRVDVSMTIQDDDVDRWLAVTVSDDGIGTAKSSFSHESENGSRLGILGMRERVDLLGGTFQIGSAGPRGTSVVIRIPLNANPSGTTQEECR